MKLMYSILGLALVVVGCQEPVDNSANEAFEKNSATVNAIIEGFQNESIDYDAYYAEDFVMNGTGFDRPDSFSLDEMIENDSKGWAMYDFEFIGDLDFLPGVNKDTKAMDGSVRYYGIWKVTLPATDSTEARSAEMQMYASYDFNEEGKVVAESFYADFGSAFRYLWDKDKEEDAEAKEVDEEEAVVE